MQPLPRSFYDRDTLAVARDLLGQYLVRETGRGRLVCRITETEAYIGRMDKACHAYQYKRTARTETLFARPGTAYLYLIYGMYHCLNFVTEAEGEPCAVLIRGAVPVENGDIIAENRFGRKEKELTAAQRREWREMLEDLWRRRIPGSNEFEPLGTMNVNRIDMKKLLGKSVQGEYGTVGYFYGHKERLWVETANLRPAIEQAPNDGRWSRKQLRAACGEKQNDAKWWEQRFPGWKMEKCIVLEPGGLHESPKREGTGWERLEPQCYVILRRREAAILRT